MNLKPLLFDTQQAPQIPERENNTIGNDNEGEGEEEEEEEEEEEIRVEREPCEEEETAWPAERPPGKREEDSDMSAAAAILVTSPFVAETEKSGITVLEAKNSTGTESKQERKDISGLAPITVMQCEPEVQEPKSSSSVKKYTSGLKRREDVILEGEGVTRRKVSEDDVQQQQQPAEMYVRLQVQRYVAKRSAPLCKGTRNKKCLFGKGDVVDVLCPDSPSSEGKAMMLVHKARHNKEFMRQRTLADYEEHLEPKGKIKSDFLVLKKGHLKLQEMAECYSILVTGNTSLWVDKRLVEELPPGTVPVQPQDFIIPMDTPSREVPRHQRHQQNTAMGNGSSSNSDGNVLVAGISTSEIFQTISQLSAGGYPKGDTGKNVFAVAAQDKNNEITSLPLRHDYGHQHHQKQLQNATATATATAATQLIAVPSVLTQTVRGTKGMLTNTTTTTTTTTTTSARESSDFVSLPLASQCIEQLRAPPCTSNNCDNDLGSNSNKKD